MISVGTALRWSLAALVSGFVAGYAKADPCTSAFEQVQAQNPNGTTTGWTAVCSSDPRDGGGSFMQFLTPNKAGTMFSGITFNGGLVYATPGAEQGDLDIGIIVDGKYGEAMSFVGRGPWGGPGLYPSVDNLFQVGGPTNRLVSLTRVPVQCPKGVPGNPAYCVREGDGFTPVYK